MGSSVVMSAPGRALCGALRLGESASATNDRRESATNEVGPMARSTYGWEDFKPKQGEDGKPGGRQLFSYDGEIRLDCRRRTSGDYPEWLFVNIRQRNGIWTRLCLDTDCTVVAQGFGKTRKEASKQL